MIYSSAQVGEDLIREEPIYLGKVFAPSSVDLVVRRDLVDNLLEIDLKAKSAYYTIFHFITQKSKYE